MRQTRERQVKDHQVQQWSLYRAGMCRREKPAVLRQPALLSLVPVPALLRFGGSLNSAGSGPIEGIIGSYGGVHKLLGQME